MTGRLKPYLLIVALLPFLFGCEPDSTLEEVKHSREFVELVQAYETDKVFASAEHYQDACLIRFADGSTLSITEFEIHDCTVSRPLSVTKNGEWWSVGGITHAVKVLSGVPASKARPVYVYHDKWSLYVHVSNGEVLEFWSVALEDQAQDVKRLPGSRTFLW